ARGRHPPAIAPPVEVLDLRAELDPQAMRAGVVLEVLDPLLTRGKVAGPPPDVIAGLGRHPSERVQAQALVPCSPARPYLVAALEDEALDAELLKHGGRGKPCGPAAADDGLRGDPLLHGHGRSAAEQIADESKRRRLGASSAVAQPKARSESRKLDRGDRPVPRTMPPLMTAMTRVAAAPVIV